MADMTFEKALKRLEKIVEDMESEDISLDSSLEKFEEGIKMVRFCREKLDKSEQKIEILLKDAEGNFQKTPFSPDKNKKPELLPEDTGQKNFAEKKYEDELPF